MPADESSDRDSKITDSSEAISPSPEEEFAPDPFDLRNHVRGIVMLVVVCILLWCLAKFGPGGADWLGDQTKALFGLQAETEQLEPATPPDPVVTEDPSVAPSAAPPVPPDPKPVTEAGGDSLLARARKTIQETLGGPEKVIVQHVAISSDQTSLVAAVKLLDEDGGVRLEEIFFEQDEFGRYISTEDSPVQPVIKIWTQE